MLCSSCSIHTNKEGYLPVVKCQILHLEISYSVCGSRVVPLWEFDSRSEQLIFGPSCRQFSRGLSQARLARKNGISVTYQDQMPKKRSMSPVFQWICLCFMGTSACSLIFPAHFQARPLRTSWNASSNAGKKENPHRLSTLLLASATGCDSFRCSPTRESW